MRGNELPRLRETSVLGIDNTDCKYLEWEDCYFIQTELRPMLLFVCTLSVWWYEGIWKKQVGRSQITKHPLGHGKDFEIYSECDGMSWKAFKQENEVVWFAFHWLLCRKCLSRDEDGMLRSLLTGYCKSPAEKWCRLGTTQLQIDRIYVSTKACDKFTEPLSSEP